MCILRRITSFYLCPMSYAPSHPSNSSNNFPPLYSRSPMANPTPNPPPPSGPIRPPVSYSSVVKTPPFPSHSTNSFVGQTSPANYPLPTFNQDSDLDSSSKSEEEDEIPSNRPPPSPKSHSFPLHNSHHNHNLHNVIIHPLPPHLFSLRISVYRCITGTFSYIQFYL